MGFGDCRGCRTGARGRMGLHRPHRLSRRGGTQTRHRQSQGGAFRRSSRQAFMPAVSPTQLANWNKNEYYASQEEYRLAIAEALREEYRRIVDAGVVLQIDDPQLASRYVLRPDLDLEECRKRAALSVELLNHALEGIPAERVRYHTCYSINIAPRIHDLEL